MAAAGILVVGVPAVRKWSAPEYDVAAPPGGGAPACERASHRYPHRLAGQELTFTGRPGVAVWGDKAVVLRCGLKPPAPTVDACVSVNGVDWIVRDSRTAGGSRTIVTFGRDPAVEAVISGHVAAIDGVLVELSRTVEPIRRYSKCLGPDDV
ncbi:DUF3515 family protein [Streptomyces sp. NBC_00859]|uniref:DUF3515 family protein n=1 Tax=Streptomyces sp. NBC_00859 TaxID=2903682 RepID=UPI0038643590|nr:DUF3515 domain-containing protein [Streptomyces sp. NBC_00859]